MRNAQISRKTGETDITIRLELDGKGSARLENGGTGIGFLTICLTPLPGTASLT